LHPVVFANAGTDLFLASHHVKKACLKMSLSSQPM